MSYRSRGAGHNWPVALVRGSTAGATTFVIVLTTMRTVDFGLGVFRAWALVTGVVGLAVVLWRPPRQVGWILTFGATVAAGIVGWLVDTTMPNFLYLVAAWAAFTGFTELFTAVRLHSGARARMFSGAVTAVLGIIALVAPMNPVAAIGCLAMYFGVLAVHSLIDGISNLTRPVPQGNPI